jgi:hypothetical protein
MHRRLTLAAISAAFLVLATASAAAHEWYSQRRDPIYSTTTCRGGHDCAPLPAHAMTFTPDGDLRVTLSLEEARLINPGRIEPFDEVIPFDRIQTAEDGRPHICLMRLKTDQRQGFYCIFLPPTG